MGAGAVGCFFGSRLARAGVPVTLVARAAHAEAIARDGLEIDSVEGAGRVAMTATTDVSALADCDAVLVAVKTPATEATAAHLGSVVPHDALLVSLQNGVDNAWRMRRMRRTLWYRRWSTFRSRCAVRVCSATTAAGA